MRQNAGLETRTPSALRRRYPSSRPWASEPLQRFYCFFWRPYRGSGAQGRYSKVFKKSNSMYAIVFLFFIHIFPGQRGRPAFAIRGFDLGRLVRLLDNGRVMISESSAIFYIHKQSFCLSLFRLRKSSIPNQKIHSLRFHSFSTRPHSKVVQYIFTAESICVEQPIDLPPSTPFPI